MAERRTNAARNEANPNAQQLAQGAPRPLPKFRTQGGARSIPSLLAIGIAVVAAGAGYHTGRQRGLQESLRGLSARPHFLVDLSVSLKAGIPSDPPGAQPSISYEDHHQSVKHLQMFFPGLLKEQLPDGEGWAIERLETTTHTGTHMDAPYHYASTENDGQPARTIDQIPLEWCLQRGVKLDFRHLPDGHVVTAQEVEAELKRIGHTLRKLDIVLVNTAAGTRYGEEDYLARGCGMGRDATLYLTTRGVRVMGTDAWSWDAPFIHTRQKFMETGDPHIIWEGHKAGRKIGYAQIEKLSNLETLPATGFSVAVFPVKIHKASGSWTRAVAILDNNQ
mmetsp:Transcript_33179/g.63705  ORF Transcript_33179/g.63705 Transcript_33179/m.63705 type:complete len:335 (+) Transcript_33179:186-1190(+)